MLQYVTDSDYNSIVNNSYKPKKGNNMLGLLSAVATVGSSIYNAWSQKNVNKQNQEYNNYILQNRLQMSASDARKAGFSPLAALGVSQPTSGASAVAPQMDFSSLANLLASAGSLDVERAKLAESKRQFDMTHPEAHDEFGEALNETKRTNDIASKNAETNAKNAETQETSVKNQNNQFFVHEGNLVSQFGDDIQLRKDIFEHDKSFKDKQMQQQFILSRQEMSQRQYEQLCNSLGVAPQVEYVSDWDTYVAKSKAGETIYKQFLQNYNRAMEKTGLLNLSNSESESSSWTLGAQANKGSSGRTGTSDSVTKSSTTSGKVGKNSSVNDTISSVANSIQETVNPSLGVGLDGGHSSSKSQGYTRSPYYLKTILAYELEHSGYKFYIYSPKGVD